MKINKKKILNNISENRNIVIGVFIIIFVFCLCLLPIISKATYSSELYSVSLDCDESGLTDTSVSCKIVLETGELNIQGFSAKISSELTYEEFKYLEGDWKNYSDTNYAAADGLVLVSDGTLGSSYIGELVYKIPREIFSDSANIMIEEVVIVDDNSLEYEIGTVEAEISVLKRDVSTLDGIGLSSGKLDKEFSPEVTEYTVNVNASTIKIVPYPTDPYSNVSGDIGEISLEYGENIFELVVTSEDTKNSTKYTLTIIRSDEEEEVLSDINTLDNITLSVGSLNEEFSSSKIEYSADVDSDKVTIDVIKTDEKSSVSGDIGEVSLEYGENIFRITVKSESGIEKVYTIKINREKKIVYEVTFDKNLLIDKDNKYVNYIVRKTTVKTLLDKVDASGYDVKIVDSNGNNKDADSVLATGDAIALCIDDEVKEKYMVSVLGDSSGDGLVDLVDLVQIRKHIVGWIDPDTKNVQRKTGIYYNALDFNQDGNIDLIDLVRMRKAILGID